MARKPRCFVCNRLRDPETGLCPTPEECDRLRAPVTRIRRAESATAARVRASEMEQANIVISRKAMSAGAARVNLRELDHSIEFTRRARSGWATRRSG